LQCDTIAEQHQQKMQQMEEALERSHLRIRLVELARRVQEEKRKQQIQELTWQVQEEKRKQQIQKLEAQVAAEQTQHHALATKLQAQEPQKRTELEQALEQALERTRQQEQELTRLVTETTKPRVGASAGARRPIFVKKQRTRPRERQGQYDPLPAN
jgi:hypothetical protein